MGIVVFSSCGWFYARLLANNPDLQYFRYFQEALAIGDAALVALSLDAARKNRSSRAPMLGQAGLAGLWLVVRLAFLSARSRDRPPLAAELRARLLA